MPIQRASCSSPSQNEIPSRPAGARSRTYSHQRRLRHALLRRAAPPPQSTHDDVHVGLPEAAAVRVAQADDAVELRPHARLLGNLARHGRRKVLPWLGEAARQLPRPAHRRREGCGEGSSAPPRLPAGCASVHPCMRLLGETRSCTISTSRLPLTTTPPTPTDVKAYRGSGLGVGGSQRVSCR